MQIHPKTCKWGGVALKHALAFHFESKLLLAWHVGSHGGEQQTTQFLIFSETPPTSVYSSLLTRLNPPGRQQQQHPAESFRPISSGTTIREIRRGCLRCHLALASMPFAASSGSRRRWDGLTVISDGQINDEQNRSNQRVHEILTWKTLPTRKRKNHGRQLTKLHYIGWGYKRRGFTTMNLSCASAYNMYL